MLTGIDYINSLKGWVGDKDFSLDRISLIANHLGDPQNSFKSIHVSGTNGKGSTCAAISSILGSAGLCVGLTISPHLISVTERIVIDGESISEGTLSKAAEAVKVLCEQLSIELSQFEVITLCAFLIFREAKVDYAVVEVGLGGRLDATNIISKPDITVIVSISDDHQEVLGNSLAEIAKEKAGIIKNKVPCVVGLVPEEVLSAISIVANSVGQVELSLSGLDFNCKSELQSLGRARYYYKELDFELELDAHLVGNHQANNLGLAIRVSRILGISSEAIISGVGQVCWPCRLEVCLWNGIEILFDCAHNLAGIHSLIKYLALLKDGPKHIVIGALQTKPWDKMLLELSSQIEHWFVIEPDSVQAQSCENLSQFISKHELGSVISFGRDYTGLVKQLAALPSGTRVLVTGSIYMVGAVRRVLGLPVQPIWKRGRAE